MPAKRAYLPEEIEIIIPAIARPRKGIAASGPFGADTMFRKQGCDAYRDAARPGPHRRQAYSTTAGLSIGSPILFSSVAHGSAHDIAGHGGRPGAVIEA